MTRNPSKISIKDNNFMDLVIICNQNATLALAANWRTKGWPEILLTDPKTRMNISKNDSGQLPQTYLVPTNTARTLHTKGVIDHHTAAI